MAGDKEIIELTEALLTDIISDSRFVFQNPGAPDDFKVTPAILGAYLKQSGYSSITVYGGTTNPDNAIGANGDLYFKSDGSVYQKSAGVWVIKVTGTGKIRKFIASGTAMPINFNTTQIPGLSIVSIFQVEYALDSTTNTQVSGLDARKVFTNSTKAAVASVNVYGNNDGTNHFDGDHWLVVG